MANETSRRFCMCVIPKDVSSEAQKVMSGRKAALLNEFRWPAASVVTVRFLEGDAALQSRVRDVAASWTGQGRANVTLNFVTSGNANVRIGLAQGAGSWSHIGTYCQSISEPKPTMNFGWLSAASSLQDVRSVVLHEFGHALGLIHEHQNPDHAISWNRPAVTRDLSGPPNNWDDATIQHNVFDLYDPATVSSTPVDPKSIMMYPIPASWTNDGFSVGFNSDLSDQDVAFIKAKYP